MKSVNVSEYARSRTSSRLKQFLAQRKRAEENLHDAEVIHDLRVSIRRLIQCLRVFGGLLAPVPTRKMRKRLRELMALCGAVRNCDVALEVLQQAGVLEQQRKSRLLTMRRDAEEALQECLANKRRWKKRKWLKCLRMEAQENAQWNTMKSLEENIADLLPALLDDFFAKGRVAARQSRLESLHQFRLQAKRFRYTLELFRRFYSSELEKCLRELRDLQQHLGAINDCAMTIALLSEDPDLAAAVHPLLHEREAGFKREWRRYSVRRQQAWRHWLTQPRSVAVSF